MSDVRLFFSKEDTARFISHLDLMHLLSRAFFRAGISLRQTQGFHPHPYVSIPLPLPLGFSSQCEILEFGLAGGAARTEVPARLNAVLPRGIRVADCYADGLPFRRLEQVRYDLHLRLSEPQAALEAIEALLAQESIPYTKKSRKAKGGEKEIDLRPQILALENSAAEPTGLALTLLLRAQNPGLNPALLCAAFARDYPALAPSYVSYHRREVLTAAGEPFR